MLTGIHFLLTYKCIFECEHCFVYSSPRAEGTFTFEQISRTLDQAEMIGTIEWIYFEGGEPFLYYPLLIESVKSAVSRGFKTGIVTNGYFATSVEDAERWLKPFKLLNIDDLSISNDALHSGEENPNSPAAAAIRAARNLGINLSSISVAAPKTGCTGMTDEAGDVMFRGRAADKLTTGIKGSSWTKFQSCPYEELENPEILHVDAYGNVQICQGISIGNMWQLPLSEIVARYDAASHPIVKYLISGGPFFLNAAYKFERRDAYIDACQLCYETRKQLLEKFPEHLAPRQVYGL